MSTMGSRPVDVKPWWLGVLAISCACSPRPTTNVRDVADANDLGRVLTAESAAERELLRQVPRLPNGSAQRIGDANVVADAPYAAASGRTCRTLHVTSPGNSANARLACSTGGPWFFVPDVFAASPATE